MNRESVVALMAVVKRVVRTLFVENAAIKAFSLVLAITLVVLVRGERDAVTTTTVKVIWEAPADRVLMNEPVQEVRLTVAGPLSKVNRLERRDMPPLRVDLSKVTSSEFFFSGSLIETPPGLRVVSISPASTTLKFDARIAKSVPVRPKLRGSPQSGFIVEGVTAIPAEVVIEGAKSVVEQMDAVHTEAVDIAGLSGPVTREARLTGIPRFADVRGAPVVRVAVKVNSEPVERVLEDLQVRTSPGLQADPPTVDVKLRGPRQELEKVQPGKLSVTAVEEKPGHPSRVEVTGLPSSMQVVSVKPQTVQLIANQPSAPGPAAPSPPAAPEKKPDKGEKPAKDRPVKGEKGDKGPKTSEATPATP